MRSFIFFVLPFTGYSSSESCIHEEASLIQRPPALSKGDPAPDQIDRENSDQTTGYLKQARLSMAQKREDMHVDISTPESLPPDCITFMSMCGVTPQNFIVEKSSEAQHGFELCCIGVGHKSTTCAAIAGEVFDGDPATMPAVAQCEELMKLSDVHGSWGNAHVQEQASLVEERAKAVVDRMIELEVAMPQQIQMLASRAAATAAVGAAALVTVEAGHLLSKVSTVGGAAIATVLAGIVTNLQHCESA